MITSLLTSALIAVLLAAQPEAPDQTREIASKVESRFVAPCCWHENLAAHNSPKAEEMRAEIGELLLAGKTEAQIVDYYVKQYGERILREPRGARGTTLVVIPAVTLLLSAICLVCYIKRRRMIPELQPQLAAGVAPVDDKDLDW